MSAAGSIVIVTEPLVFKTPIVMSGSLGIRDVPSEYVPAVMEQYRILGRNEVGGMPVQPMKRSV